MLRKQLLRHSRNISESLTSTSLPQALVRRSAPFSTASLAPSTRAALPAYQSSRILGRRWQSTDADKTATSSPDAASSEAKSEATEAAKEDPTKVELEKKNKEVIDLKDKYLRSVADYRNLQDRTKRDMDSAKQFAIQRFAADLLDSIDNLDRALVSVPKESVTESSTADASPDYKKDLLSLFSGLKMTEEILLGTLKKHGLERFDPTEGEGRKFDPNTDEATFFTKVEGKQDNDVFFVQSKGFKLNGRVIRAAKVGVVKNS